MKVAAFRLLPGGLVMSMRRLFLHPLDRQIRVLLHAIRRNRLGSQGACARLGLRRR